MHVVRGCRQSRVDDEVAIVSQIFQSRTGKKRPPVDETGEFELHSLADRQPMQVTQDRVDVTDEVIVRCRLRDLRQRSARTGVHHRRLSICSVEMPTANFELQ